MNAPERFDALLAASREPFPASRKVHVEGSLPGVRVPMREITLSNGETLTVYDTAGPYTDPDAAIDIRSGLPALREAWIAARGDSEAYAGRAPGLVDDGGKPAAATLDSLRAEALALQRTPRRALSSAGLTQMHYARRGIVTPEMEFVALRENGRRDWTRAYLNDAEREARLAGQALGAAIPEIITPEFVRDEVARGRAVIPANINHPELEPMAIGRNFKVKIN
ncbi:phosphomethylpyrimidine synthase ThiC, partial [Aquabacterium sp.]|uniref:phosphomethylpyrimidine synthase ThiC n=1 Tax=Aquabacterium sp. TaxID=1872578 RepID=UPI002B999A32